jgi:hypothetical protein
LGGTTERGKPSSGHERSVESPLLDKRGKNRIRRASWEEGGVMEQQGGFDPGVLDRTHAMAWHIATLAELLKDSNNRQGFIDDPYGKLEEHGIDQTFLPSGAVEKLQAMGPEELGELSKYTEKLVEAGFYLEATETGAGEQQDPKVCFF